MTLQDKVAEAGEVYGTAAELLGGRGGMAERPQDPFGLHDSLRGGLPGSALSALLDNLSVLPKTSPDLEAALGISLRTMQRKKGDAAQRLTPEQAGRAWQFAEVLAQATRVLGSQEEAERWLEKPAIGLDRHRPIELLSTPVGVRMVTQYLRRLEHGVYT